MIPDDLKDDDILDDDFDIDDDFEDDWDEQDENIAPDSSATSEATNGNTGQKSFLQKFFLPIVIGVVLIFGGIFLAGQGLFSSAPEQASYDDSTQDIASVEAVLVDTETEPSNDPFAAQPLTNDAEDGSAPLAEQDTPLTPLPGEASESQIELADLEAELQSDDAPLEDTLALVDGTDTQAADDDIFSDINAEIMTDTPDDAVNDIFEEPNSPPSFEDETLMPPAVAEEPAMTDDSDLIIADDAVAVESIDTMAVVDTDAIAALQAENSALIDSKNMLENAVAESQETIDGLNSEIESLKAKIKSIDVQPNNIAQETPVTPTSEPVDVVPAAKVVKTPADPAPVAAQWVLRSAQPGKATIARKGSNDMRNIEVGSVIKGLGRIKSINAENGQWVVRGTRGMVQQ